MNSECCFFWQKRHFWMTSLLRHRYVLSFKNWWDFLQFFSHPECQEDMCQTYEKLPNVAIFTAKILSVLFFRPLCICQSFVRWEGGFQCLSPCLLEDTWQRSTEGGWFSMEVLDRLLPGHNSTGVPWSTLPLDLMVKGLSSNRLKAVVGCGCV